jgi:hypothetical protein
MQRTIKLGAVLILIAIAGVILFLSSRSNRSPAIALHFQFFETNALGIFATFTASNCQRAGISTESVSQGELLFE